MLRCVLMALLSFVDVLCISEHAYHYAFHSLQYSDIFPRDGPMRLSSVLRKVKSHGFKTCRKFPPSSWYRIILLLTATQEFQSHSQSVDRSGFSLLKYPAMQVIMQFAVSTQKQEQDGNIKQSYRLSINDYTSKCNYKVKRFQNEKNRH